MIQPPRRSVTRFFIPMIDVLTLLFCMFLLMPIFRENESLSQEGPSGPSTAEEMKKEIEARQKDLQELYKDQERARVVLQELTEMKRGLLQQKIYVRLLYISPKDGSLYFFNPADAATAPLKIDHADVAADLIGRHKKEAGDRQLLYIFQEPRDDKGIVAPVPTFRQEAEYKRWFQAVNYEGCIKAPPSKEAK
jgi:hypothetical protein